jgi:hypothetical protein
MFLIVPVIAIVMATWRSVLRLFDPDEEERPVAVSAPAAPARSAPTRPNPSPAPG